MQSTIRVEIPQNPYSVAIAPGLLDRLGDSLGSLRVGEKVLLVSNPEIFACYGARAIASLEAAGVSVSEHLIPAGEPYKTLASIEALYNTAFAKRLERSSTLVALGGGVIGDMTGFAAATWLRGINFVQVPTSLLAMVDAAIGGKTGVNHPQGKNLIGAFYQPRWVAIDPQVLATLPEREWRAGMAEVIKYGIIWDAELFARLEAADRLDSFSALDPELLQFILTRSCQAKADVVAKDEKEAGLRAILNYGHTIGHAIESLTGYRALVHGEAVAIGAIAVGEIAVELGCWTAQERDRQHALVAKAGLPTRIPETLSAEAIVEALQSDKKVKAGKVRFVLPTAIGAATVSDRVPPELVARVVRQLGAVAARAIV